MVQIIAIFLLFGVLTIMNISEMHAKLVESYYSSYTGSSPIVGLASRYHVIQVERGLFNNTGAPLLDHRTLKLLKISFLA